MIWKLWIDPAAFNAYVHLNHTRNFSDLCSFKSVESACARWPGEVRLMTPNTDFDATQARTWEQLTEFIALGAKPKWLMFWSHQPEADGGIGKGCLSQWWPCRFTVDEIEYASAEHWMMASKARLFGDLDATLSVLAARTPAEAKGIGRLVDGFDEQIWEQRRFDLVVEGNVAKFGQNLALRDFLLATKDRVLVEASPRDRIWGIGLSSADEGATNPEHWRGLNLLGFALMEARSRLVAG